MQSKHKRLMIGCVGGFVLLGILSFGLNTLISRMGMDAPQGHSRKASSGKLMLGEVAWDDIKPLTFYQLQKRTVGYDLVGADEGPKYEVLEGEVVVVNERVLHKGDDGKTYPYLKIAVQLTPDGLTRSLTRRSSDLKKIAELGEIETWVLDPRLKVHTIPEPRKRK
jgi:hypothetical protein